MKRFMIQICEGCLNLEGQECHHPECVFCRRATSEVGYLLDILMIRPVINGVRIQPLGQLESNDVDQLQLDVKYLHFDLDATRRERDEMQCRIEELDKPE